MHPSELRRTIRELLEPTVERLGFDLVAVELVGGTRRPVLRLSIDRADGVGSVGADDCARVTHRVSPLLDEADPISGSYDLEVSSPGIERPVQRREDFARFAGFRVRLRLEEGMPRRRYTGTIVKVQGDEIHVEVDGEVHVLDFPTIDAAHLVLDLSQYQELAEGLPPVPDAGPIATDAGPIAADAGRPADEASAPKEEP